MGRLIGRDHPIRGAVDPAAPTGGSLVRPSDPAVSLLAAALGAKCPRCGRGRLFSGFLAIARRCTVCDLDLARHDSGDGPAVFLIFILGFTAVPLALWLEFTHAPPVWVHALVLGGFVVGLTLALLRPSKALTVALQYRHRRRDFRDDEAETDRGGDDGASPPPSP